MVNWTQHTLRFDSAWPIPCIMWKTWRHHKTGSTQNIALSPDSEVTAIGNMYKKYGWNLDLWFRDTQADRQTKRQTNRQTERYASGTTLVTRPGAHSVPVVCSGVSLCAWHSSSVSGRQPAADIRDRRSSSSSFCWRCWCRQLVSQLSATARFLWLQLGHGTNSLPAQTKIASSLIIFRRQTKAYLFRQSFSWRKSITVLSAGGELNLNTCFWFVN